MKLLCVMIWKYTFRKWAEVTIRKNKWKLQTQTSVPYTEEFHEWVPLPSALCHQSSSDLAKEAILFSISSDEETGSARGSELAKWHRSEAVILFHFARLFDKDRSLKMKCVALVISSLLLKFHLSRSPWKGFNKSSVVDPRNEDIRVWNHRPL